MFNYVLILLLILPTHFVAGMQKSYCQMTTDGINDLMRAGRIPRSYLDLVCGDLLRLLRVYIKHSHRKFIKTHFPPQPYELSYHKTTVRKVHLAANGKRALIAEDGSNIAAFWNFDRLPPNIPKLLVALRRSILQLTMSTCSRRALMSSDEEQSRNKKLLLWDLGCHGASALIP